ncbi:CAP domain-containing protein [Pseudonocardia zijingensis]
MLALATGVVLVAGVAVATFPDELVPTALRTDDAIAAATGADVVPRAAHVDDRPPPSEISTVHAYAAIPGVTSGGPEKPPEPPPPPPAPAAPKREPVSVGGAVGEVIALTNERRREAGCGALAPDGRLTRAAQAHASDMHEKGYFDHVSRDGRRFEHRVRAAGYPRPGAENIAKGQTSARQVVREWMASPSHRSAMLTCAFTTIGVARSGNYWVQEFGK